MEEGQWTIVIETSIIIVTITYSIVNENFVIIYHLTDIKNFIIIDHSILQYYNYKSYETDWKLIILIKSNQTMVNHTELCKTNTDQYSKIREDWLW